MAFHAPFTKIAAEIASGLISIPPGKAVDYG